MKSFKLSKSDYVSFPDNGEFRNDFRKFNFSKGRSGKKIDDQIIESYFDNAIYIKALRNDFISDFTVKKFEKYLSLFDQKKKKYKNLLLFRGVRPWKDFKIGDVVEDLGMSTKTNVISYADKYTSKTLGVIFIINYPNVSEHYKFDFMKPRFEISDIFRSSFLFSEFITYPGEKFVIVEEGMYKETKCFYLKYIGNCYQDFKEIKERVDPKIEPIFTTTLEPLIKKFTEREHRKNTLFIFSQNEIFTKIIVYRYDNNERVSDEWCRQKEINISNLILEKPPPDVKKMDNEVNVYGFDTIRSLFYSGYIKKLYNIEDFEKLYRKIMSPVKEEGVIMMTYTTDENVVEHLVSGAFDKSEYLTMGFNNVSGNYLPDPKSIRKFYWNLFTLKVVSVEGFSDDVLPQRVL